MSDQAFDTQQNLTAAAFSKGRGRHSQSTWDSLVRETKQNAVNAGGLIYTGTEVSFLAMESTANQAIIAVVGSPANMLAKMGPAKSGLLNTLKLPAKLIGGLAKSIA